jgi:hypothetical protein
MHAFFRACEQDNHDEDDDFASGQAPRAARRFRLRFLSRLALPCYVCEGRRRLWVTDEARPRGRFVRCVACRGKGKMRGRS